MPQPSKIESLLGFCLKAGKVQFGLDNILGCRKRQYLILYDAALSENSKNKLLNFASTHAIPLYDSPAPLATLLHREGIKAVSLQNAELAKEIIKQLPPKASHQKP